MKRMQYLVGFSEQFGQPQQTPVITARHGPSWLILTSCASLVTEGGKLAVRSAQGVVAGGIILLSDTFRCSQLPKAAESQSVYYLGLAFGCYPVMSKGTHYDCQDTCMCLAVFDLVQFSWRKHWQACNHA